MRLLQLDSLMTSYTDARPEDGRYVPLPSPSRQVDAVGDNGQLIQSSPRTIWEGATSRATPLRGCPEGGKVTPVNGAPPDSYLDPRLSPDGKRLAMTIAGGGVAMWDFEREAMTRLPRAASAVASHVAWMPDGGTSSTWQRHRNRLLFTAALMAAANHSVSTSRDRW